MAKTKREQLKKIVNKEYTDILKEVKRNDAYFNRIAYEHVISTLIKEGVLSEGWADRGWQNLVADQERAESNLGYGESWGDARRKRGMPEWLPQAALEEVPPPIPADARVGGPPPIPVSGAAAEEGAAAMSGGPESGETAGFPQHLMPRLIEIGQSADATYRNNIPKMGEAVYTQLEKEIGGMKTQDQTAQLAIEILNTVVGLLRSKNPWTSGIDKRGPG